jgi:hypothetical protein
MEEQGQAIRAIMNCEWLNSELFCSLLAPLADYCLLPTACCLLPTAYCRLDLRGRAGGRLRPYGRSMTICHQGGE